MLGRLFAQVLGFVLLIIGLIGILTPIPFGLVFLAAALVILIPTSPGTVRTVQDMRRRSSLVDRALHSMTLKTPAPYRRLLRRTERPLI